MVAFAAAVVLTPVAIAGLRRWHIIDHPNERSSHDRPVIRGGGLALVGAAAVAVAVRPETFAGRGTGVLVAAAAFAAIGLAEDLRGIPAVPRLGLQAVAAALALPWLLEGLTGPVAWQVVFGAGVLVWLVAYANAFNFMDGINGISATQTAVAGGAFALLGAIEDVPMLATSGAITVGLAVGFLPFNFPNARVFLGDVGSYLLGAWLAALLVIGLRANLSPEAVIAPLALYLADTGTTLVRRIRQGEPWHTPHRRHAYQELVKRGWSHTKTTGLVAATLTACAGLGLLTATGTTTTRLVADAGIALLLTTYLLLPHVLASRSERRTSAVGSQA